MAEFSSYAPGTPSWVDLSSDDVAAAAAYYGAVFGWEFADLGPDAGAYGFLQLNGKTVAGIGPKMMEGHPTVWTTSISVADIDATVAAITAA